MITALALTFFLVANPLGNAPAIIALTKRFDFQRHRLILLREAFFALLIALFFQYFGEFFLGLLHLQSYAVTITGGLLLLLVGLSMIFPAGTGQEARDLRKQEPFIVPIATPILSGPGLLAIIMLKSQLAESHFQVTCAILLAWVGVFAVLGMAPYLYRLLGKRGFGALEQVMGMLLCLVATEMLVKGSALLINQWR